MEPLLPEPIFIGGLMGLKLDPRVLLPSLARLILSLRTFCMRLRKGLQRRIA